MTGENRRSPPASRWLANPQMLVGLSAVLLSVCGLFISIYEASLMRRAQRASVWPHVTVAASIGTGRSAIWVENTGVGPARVQAAAVSLAGEPLDDWPAVVGEIGAGEAAAELYQSLVGGTVLPARSERETLFAVGGPEAADGGRALAEAVGRAIFDGDLDVAVCYCSVYDECWSTSLQALIARSRWTVARAVEDPREVESCDGSAVSAI